MINSSSVSSKAQHHSSSNAITAPAKSATAPASNGSGLPDHPGDKSYATHLRLPSPARDYLSASFCPFSAGQYTEF
jgi:hypothetical protein